MIEPELRQHWWAAVAQVTRATGDLGVAEDAVQEACLAALEQWPAHPPADPRAWLVGTALHKAYDHVRREARRPAKEAAAMRDLTLPSAGTGDVAPEDQLALIFLCCHPALDPATRLALTLRAVCGLDTHQIAAVLLTPEPTVAKRLVRARRKIRDSVIPMTVPAVLPERLDSVLRVVYLVFTEGHRDLVRADLCDLAIGLARTLATLLPEEPEVTGLLALLLCTDARRAARTGDLVLLEHQDRSKYDRVAVAEGEAMLERALRLGRPGPYQIQAAIAACALDRAHCGRHGLAGDRRAVRRTPALRTESGARGQQGDRGGHGRGARGRSGHPRLGRAPSRAGPLAVAAHRPRRPVAPARSGRRRRRRLPDGTGTGPGPAERAFAHRRIAELA